jgi:hypothetical protein
MSEYKLTIDCDCADTSQIKLEYNETDEEFCLTIKDDGSVDYINFSLSQFDDIYSTMKNMRKFINESTL